MEVRHGAEEVQGAHAMIVWKQIKPARLNEPGMRRAILSAMQETGKEIKKDFDRTTVTWKSRPEFEIVMSITKGLELFVWTDNEIYGYVSEGTEEHVILPVNAKALRFREGYHAKTKPRVIQSFSGGPFGKVVFAAGVIHPGTEAREFAQVIQKKWQPRFKRRMEKAMGEARQASGHAI